MKTYLFLFSLVLIVRCTKNEEIPATKDNYLDKILLQYHMVPYTENVNYCVSLHKYIYEGAPYFAYDSCIEDRISNPFDCSGIYFITKDGKITGEIDITKLELFTSKVQYVGVVGILKN